jgi:uncharacterized zinc-type alcohol dehydrogenase-like protein
VPLRHSPGPDEWPAGSQFQANYPCLPGHEIAGTVAEVGWEVVRYSAGDRVAVRCLTNSCGYCASCKEGLQQFCENGAE